MKLILLGHVPGKKNLLRRSKNGGMFRDAAVAEQISKITYQARCQWKDREPLVRPAAKVLFHITDMRSDLDNKWTTVLDCLKDAGVIKNDNIKNGPRPVLYDWIESSDERVEVWLEGGLQQLGLRAMGLGQ